MSGTLKTLAIFLGGIVTALTFVFGSGAYWQYKDSILKAEQAPVERATKMSELRKRASDTLYEILQNAAKYNDALDAYQKTQDPKLNNDANQILMYIKSLQEDYRQLEKNLAQLENRPPRNVDVDFIRPKPPTGLTVQ